MPKEKKQHPHYDWIVTMLRDGASDALIRRTVPGVHGRTLPPIRAALGLPRSPGVRTTKEAKLTKFSTAPDENGHILWTGRRDNGGQPEIRQLNHPVPATHVAFEVRTGRPPVGLVQPECGMQACVAPDHMSDRLERRSLRMVERSMHGMPPKPWDVCPQGLHDWDEHGRIQPNLRYYCGGCNSARNARVRDAKKEES